MAEHQDDPEIFWVDPKRRGIFPLDGFHISRSLARALRKEDYSVSVNRCFADVLDGCADRSETWINNEIRSHYIALHEMGNAHSLEVWSEEGVLIGGVYGVTLGKAFFGESMFSRRSNASKIALAYLVDLLNRQDFRLFDTQFLTEHLATLGGVEISRADYKARLADALDGHSEFSGSALSSAIGVLQRNAQTS